MSSQARASDVHGIAKLIPSDSITSSDVYDLCARINEVLQRAAMGNPTDVIPAAASAACKFFAGNSTAHIVAGCNVIMSIIQCVLQCPQAPSLDSREVKRATAALMAACAQASPTTAAICAVTLRCWSQCDTHGCVNHPTMLSDIGCLLQVCDAPAALADAAAAAAALSHRAHVKASKRGTAPSPQATLAQDIAALSGAVVAAATSKSVDLPPVQLALGLFPQPLSSANLMGALLACTAVQQAHVGVVAGAYDVHLLSLLRCLSSMHSALSDALAVGAASASDIAQAAVAVTKSVQVTIAHVQHSSVCMVVSPQLLRVVVDALRLAQAILRAPASCVPPPLAAALQAGTSELLQSTVAAIGPASCKYLSAAAVNWLHELLVAAGGSPLPGRLPLPGFPAQTKTGGRGSKRTRSVHVVGQGDEAAHASGEPVVDFGADYIRLDAAGPGGSSGANRAHAAAAASRAAAASSALHSVPVGPHGVHATPVHHAACCVRACAVVWGARFSLPLSHPVAEAALKIAGASDAAARMLPHAEVPLAYTAVGCHRSVRLAAEVVLALTSAAGAAPAALLQQSLQLEEAAVQARRMQLAAPSTDALPTGEGGASHTAAAASGGLLGGGSAALQTGAVQATAPQAAAAPATSAVVTGGESAMAGAGAQPAGTSSLQAEASDSEDEDVPDIV